VYPNQERVREHLDYTFVIDGVTTVEKHSCLNQVILSAHAKILELLPTSLKVRTNRHSVYEYVTDSPGMPVEFVLTRIGMARGYVKSDAGQYYDS
jgi:hypothetical protein